MAVRRDNLLGLLACLLLGACAGWGEGPEVFMTDGFDGGFVPHLWGRGGECLTAGSASFDTVDPRSGRGALTITVGPGTRPPCQGSGDDSERSELWVANRYRMPYGSDLWYGFSFRVSGTVADDDENRLVIGQWKQAGPRTPMVAQRFKNRIFHISASSDGCRVLLAQAAGVLPDGDGYCRPEHTGLRVLLSEELPDPFAKWVDMVYHIRSGQDGLIEIWADGVKVAHAEGVVGYPDDGKDQYFKFGPYRDPVAYVTTAHLDNFTRGHSFEEVDPRRFDP